MYVHMWVESAGSADQERLVYDDKCILDNSVNIICRVKEASKPIHDTSYLDTPSCNWCE